MNILSSRQKLQHKNGKKVCILKRLKRDIQRKTISLMTLQLSSRNRVIMLKATETSVIFRLVKSTNNTLYGIKEIPKIIQVIMI